MWKWVGRNWHFQELAERLPALLDVEDEETVLWNCLFDLLQPLVVKLNRFFKTLFNGSVNTLLNKIRNKLTFFKIQRKKNYLKQIILELFCEYCVENAYFNCHFFLGFHFIEITPTSLKSLFINRVRRKAKRTYPK